MGMQAGTAGATNRPRSLATMQALALAGCLLFGVSILLPVMRWNVNATHSTAGSARVFGADDSYTLVDGGFAGADLVPFAAFAVSIVAVAALASRVGRWVWWVQVAALAIGLYYPGWVLYVFVKKLEDQVDPAAGVLVLVVSFAAMIAGSVSWTSRTDTQLEFDGE